MKKLTKLAILGVIVVVIGLSGCSAKIDIIGEGDVLSESGSRNCYLETPDCQETVVGAFQETFTAVPRAGYEFEGWDYCQKSAGNVCTFDVDAATVQKAWNQTLPAVVARFVPIEASQGLVMESFTIRIQSCTLTEQLRYDASCAPLIGQDVSVSLMPDSNFLRLRGYASSDLTGHYNETAGGWVFTGVTEYGAADWVTTVVRQGDEIVISQSVRQTDGAGDIGYNRTTVSTIN